MQYQAHVISAALNETQQRFDELDQTQEPFIVHADMSKSNMIMCPDNHIAPIDFSLCGYSHFYMDIGGLFGHIDSDTDRRTLIEGYRSIRDLEIRPYYIEPYFALQVILFIACQYERAAEWDWFGGAMERWCRDIFKPLADQTAFLLV